MCYINADQAEAQVPSTLSLSPPRLPSDHRRDGLTLQEEGALTECSTLSNSGDLKRGQKTVEKRDHRKWSWNNVL